MVQRDLVAQQDVLALLGLAQVVARAPHDDVAAVLDEQPDELQQPQLLRLPPDDRQQDHPERFLHLRVLEKIVEDELRLFAALQLDHDAHAVAVAFVAHVGDAFDLLGLHQLRDALDQLGLVDLVGNFRHHDVLAVLPGLLDRRLGPHREAAASRLVGLLDSLTPRDVPARWQIRPRNQLHHFFQRGFRLFDHQHRGVNDLPQVVRRNVGGHAHGDAARAVHQQVRHSRRQHRGLLLGFVEVRQEIYGFLLDVRQ